MGVSGVENNSKNTRGVTPIWSSIYGLHALEIKTRQIIASGAANATLF